VRTPAFPTRPTSPTGYSPGSHPVTDLVVIFRTHSDIEAQIVRSLLEAHGVMSVISSDVPHSIFPLSVDGLGEVRIAVHPGEAEEAVRIIAGHRTELKNGEVVRLRDEFEALQQSIGYRFHDRGLLEHAMTHTSRANEDVSGGVADNESMEFLGDALLGFVIADMLFRDFPAFDEGQKSKTKAALVSTATLARQAERLHLGDHLLLGRGEEKTGGRQKQALLADGYEALLAAIYLDGGVEHARAFIVREFGGLIDDVRRDGVSKQDYKSALQELLQSRDLPLPEYRLVGALGPDHRKLFEIEVVVKGERLASATGPSKKEAEQEAARMALRELSRSDA
jgi:ribonuclease-3